MTDVVGDRLTIDAGLRARARKVIPGGLYGHQNVGLASRGATPSS